MQWIKRSWTAYPWMFEHNEMMWLSWRHLFRSKTNSLVYFVYECFPRNFDRFKVCYQREESDEDSEGEILLITPRDSQHDESKAIDEIAGVDLHPLEEPDGLFHDRVSNTSKLTLCCCECCHRESCHGFSKIFCNAFPQHITANQFFTPQMFLAYHSEGYRACVEANADGFLKHIVTERRQWETCVWQILAVRRTLHERRFRDRSLVRKYLNVSFKKKFVKRREN